MAKTKEEQFIWNIREAMRFVRMGSGSKHEGVFNILEPIVEMHIKQFMEDPEEEIRITLPKDTPEFKQARRCVLIVIEDHIGSPLKVEGDVVVVLPYKKKVSLN